MAFAFPADIENSLLPDTAFAAAYDALSPQERSYVKTAIARMVPVCGHADVLGGTRTQAMRQGFSLHEAVRPAEWMILFFDAEYAAPTSILAAFLPAMLAGVSDILVCRVVGEKGAQAVAPTVLASLELAGQELCVELDAQRALALLKDCHAASLRGRAIFLGASEQLDFLGAYARSAGIRVRSMAEPTRIAVDVGSLPNEYAAEPYGMLRFAHPHATFSLVPPQRERGAAEPFSAVLCGEEAATSLVARFPLVLTPGHEACWLWQDICPDFFLERSRAFSLSGQAKNGGIPALF